MWAVQGCPRISGRPRSARSLRQAAERISTVSGSSPSAAGMIAGAVGVGAPLISSCSADSRRAVWPMNSRTRHRAPRARISVPMGSSPRVDRCSTSPSGNRRVRIGVVGMQTGYWARPAGFVAFVGRAPTRAEPGRRRSLRGRKHRRASRDRRYPAQWGVKPSVFGPDLAGLQGRHWQGEWVLSQRNPGRADSFPRQRWTKRSVAHVHAPALARREESGGRASGGKHRAGTSHPPRARDTRRLRAKAQVNAPRPHLGSSGKRSLPPSSSQCGPDRHRVAPLP